MLVLIGIAAGLVLGLTTGGHLANVAAVRFRWPLFLVATLLIKEVGLIGPFGRLDLAPVIYALSLIGLVGWTIWHLETLRGIWLVTSSGVLNVIPIIANCGHMPVYPPLAGRGPHALLEKGTYGQYTLMTSHTNFNWLGDWIAMPGPLARVLPQVYSPGDLVAVIGLGAVAFFATRPAATATK